LAEMLGHLEHQIVLFIRDARIADRECVQDPGQLSLGKLDVDHRSDYLVDLAFGHAASCPRKAFESGKLAKTRAASPTTPGLCQCRRYLAGPATAGEKLERL